MGILNHKSQICIYVDLLVWGGGGCFRSQRTPRVLIEKNCLMLPTKKLCALEGYQGQMANLICRVKVYPITISGGGGGITPDLKFVEQLCNIAYFENNIKFVVSMRETTGTTH